MKVLSAVLMAAMAMVQAVHADKFCTGIRAVVADARTGFDGLRGERTEQRKSSVEPFYVVDYYAARGWPDGALTCYIERRHDLTRDGHRFPNYYCEYPVRGKDKQKALRKLTGRIAACVKGAESPAESGLNGDGGMLTWNTKQQDIHFSAFAGPSSPNIRVLIQAENF